MFIQSWKQKEFVYLVYLGIKKTVNDLLRGQLVYWVMEK